MNKTKLIFLRHADTQKDPSVNAALWGLSENGQIEARNVADIQVMQDIDEIYVSSEQKTLLTVKPLADKLHKKPIIMNSFDEVRRGDKFLTKEEFEAEKEKQLLDLSFAAFGGESGLDALARFKDGIESLPKDGKTILIVSHGTILNIYFASILNKIEELPLRWKRTGFCSYGVIEDGVVVRDIVDPIE